MRGQVQKKSNIMYKKRSTHPGLQKLHQKQELETLLKEDYKEKERLETTLMVNKRIAYTSQKLFQVFENFKEDNLGKDTIQVELARITVQKGFNEKEQEWALAQGGSEHAALEYMDPWCKYLFNLFSTQKDYLSKESTSKVWNRTFKFMAKTFSEEIENNYKSLETISSSIKEKEDVLGV